MELFYFIYLFCAKMSTAVNLRYWFFGKRNEKFLSGRQFVGFGRDELWKIREISDQKIMRCEK